MTVYAGQGDARRTLALLWGAAPPAAPRTGPRPALSVDAVVTAAIEVADAGGTAALSMRAVGERLGRTAMALYTYVPGKDELLDLMHDRALAELPSREGESEEWRSAVTIWAEDLYDCYLRHPWMLRVSQARPVLGPAELAAMESLLRALAPAALAPARLRGAVAALWQFVRGLAAATADAHGAAEATGIPDEAWWNTRSSTLADLAPDLPQRFPLFTAMQSAPAPPRPLHEGLAVLLDGISASATHDG